MSFHPSSKLPPVIYDGTPGAYHAPQKARRGDPAFVMSRGELRDFAACPRKWIKGIPNGRTKPMEWGNLMDVIFTTPQHFETIYAVAREVYEAKGMECPKCKSVTISQKCAKCKCERVEITLQKEWDWNATICDEWRKTQELAGKTCIKSSLASEAWKAHARLKEDDTIASIMAVSKTQVQVNVEWHDKKTGLIVPFKALLDIVPDPASEWGDTIFDYKTTESAERLKWIRRCYNDGLYYQAGAYIKAFNGATGAKYINFGHIIQESDEPYEPTHRLLDIEFLQLGINDFERDMRRYCRCLTEGKWPGFDTESVFAEPWMMFADASTSTLGDDA